jgi:hypothetical protein
MDEKDVILWNEMVSFITRLHCRITVLEELASENGVPRSDLERRFEDHWLRRQVQAEDLIGPGKAAQIFDEQEPPNDPAPPHAPPEEE